MSRFECVCKLARVRACARAHVCACPSMCWGLYPCVLCGPMDVTAWSQACTTIQAALEQESPATAARTHISQRERACLHRDAPTHAQTQTHTLTHARTRAHTHEHTHARTYTPAHTHTHSFTHPNTHTHTHTHTLTHTHTHTHTDTHTHTRTHTHTHTHTHPHTHIHSHTLLRTPA